MPRQVNFWQVTFAEGGTEYVDLFATRGNVEWVALGTYEAVTGRKPLAVARIAKKDAQQVFGNGLVQERRTQAIESFIPASALARPKDSA